VTQSVIGNVATGGMFATVGGAITGAFMAVGAGVGTATTIAAAATGVGADDMMQGKLVRIRRRRRKEEMRPTLIRACGGQYGCSCDR
jgi:hypothetical protein